MPYTVPASFDRFHDNINLSGDHRETSNARKDRVISLLENHFEILEAFATGSIPRYTALRGSADLDVMVVLHYGKHIQEKKPSQVLKAVRDALSEYRTGVRRNGQAVTLSYDSWPNVDIVPVARMVDASGAVLYYLVPDMNREEWIHSKPGTHTRDILDRTSSYGGEFRKIIKMAKCWNGAHGHYLQSYHIEVLALRALEGDFGDYPWDVSRFFNSAYNLLGSSLWHNDTLVDEYLDYTSRKEALTRLATAKDKSSTAWYATYSTNDDHEKAIGLWRQIFGDDFPAYGT